MERILSCGCGDTDKFAKDAFKILFPLEEIPPIVHSMGIMKDKQLRDVVNALVEGKEKYAYYILVGSDQIQVWDLIKGKQIQ